MEPLPPFKFGYFKSSKTHMTRQVHLIPKQVYMNSDE